MTFKIDTIKTCIPRLCPDEIIFLKEVIDGYLDAFKAGELPIKLPPSDGYDLPTPYKNEEVGQ